MRQYSAEISPRSRVLEALMVEIYSTGQENLHLPMILVYWMVKCIVVAYPDATINPSFKHKVGRRVFSSSQYLMSTRNKIGCLRTVSSFNAIIFCSSCFLHMESVKSWSNRQVQIQKKCCCLPHYDLQQ